MNKETLLQELTVRVNNGEIRREEILTSLNESSATVVEAQKSSRFSVTKMLYTIGVIIVIIGLMFFAAQVWNEIGAAGRILVTLGLGILFALLGGVLLKQNNGGAIGAAFHLIGGLLIPGGALVALYEINSNIQTPWPIAMIFALIFLFYSILTLIQKNIILTFFTIANATVAIYMAVFAILENGSFPEGQIIAYLTMVVGISYLLLARSFQGTWNERLVGLLYFFGITGILGAAFNETIGQVIWQLIYIPIIIGSILLAVHLKSRSILTSSTIFLIIFVSYITSEYFADSVGWPLALVFLGLLFIGLGYLSIAINRKYIKG